MIEFFFDCSSPWTYLAFHNIQLLAQEFGEEISWRPILVGGIFNTINPSVYATRENPVPAKLAYQKKDMADWARSAGLAIKMRPTVFPVNSVKAMRGCIFLGKDMVPFARAVFEIYWGERQGYLAGCGAGRSLPARRRRSAKFFAGIGQQAIKDQLKANTDEVMARGGFGSPTIFLDKTDMYFGNDRMPLIRDALTRRKSERGVMPKAVVCRELGPPENLRLETLPPVPLVPGQVRVAMHAAGINFPDILMAAGEYQLKPELPFTPGVEAAGEVTEVEGVNGVAVGEQRDRQIATWRLCRGGGRDAVTTDAVAKKRSTMRRARRFLPRMAPPITH